MYYVLILTMTLNGGIATIDNIHSFEECQRVKALIINAQKHRPKAEGGNYSKFIGDCIPVNKNEQ